MADKYWANGLAFKSVSISLQMLIFIETKYELASIRNQAPEHTSNFDTHQKTFYGTEENMRLASSECANIPIPYLLLLIYRVRKRNSKMGAGTLICLSQINICSRCSQDLATDEWSSAKIATI